MRPTPLRYPAIPLLCLLLSATACVEEETLDAPESGSLSSVSNNLETPEAAEERSEESANEAAAEGDIRSDVAGAAPFYNGYLCGGELVLFGNYDSPEDAAATCSATDLGNPQLGGLRCFVGEELVYDGCAADSSAASEVALGRYVVDFCDQPGVIQTEAISLSEARENCALNDSYNPERVRCLWNDEVLLDRCDGSETVVDSAPAIDEACYLECRSIANAVIEACRSYG